MPSQPETIRSLPPGAVLALACACGHRPRIYGSDLKAAGMGFVTLSQLDGLLECGLRRCQGRLKLTEAP